jgi:hypothetical protein
MQTASAEQTTAVPMPTTAAGNPPGKRTMGMRIYAFVELGVLLLIWILSIVSLSIPSILLSWEMYPADAISEALGIPSIILIFFIIIRLIILLFVRKTFFRGKIVKIALWVAAGLWITGTVIHIIIAIAISVKSGEAMVNGGLALGIVIIPIHVCSAILGGKAVDRLL